MDQPPPAYPPASFGGSPNAPQPLPTPKRRPLSFWLAILFAACSGLAGLVILVLFLSMGGIGPVKPNHNLIEQEVEGNGHAKIAWIQVHGVLLRDGPLGSLDNVDRTIKTLEMAGDDDAVKAVVLDVDSPGGGVTESDQIYHAIQKLKGEHGKKVVVLMGDVAASGGYYISAPADRILAHPTTITGSIGVISEFFNVEGLCEKLGVKADVVKSGTFKDIGSMTRPMTPADRRIFQRLVDSMYDKFVERVLAGRGSVVLADKSKFTEAHLRRIADGRIYTADEALTNGLIDQIGYRDDAIAEAKKLAGVSDARIVEYLRRPALFDLLGARTNVPMPTISIDAGSLLKVMSPRLLYLWTS